MSKKTRKHKVAIVTGGAGFIGAHLVNALIDEDFEVHVIDNLVNGNRSLINKKAIFHKTDVTKPADLKKVFGKVGEGAYVFHLACLPRVKFSIDFPRETHSTNIDGTFNVLMAAKESHSKRVIYSASSSAYGDQPILPLVETMTPMPKSPYGLQKYIGELYCSMFSKIYGLETVSLRYFNVYGPKQPPSGSYAQAIPKFLDQMRRGVPITVTGDGKQTRDCTNVSDVVRANLLAALSPKVGNGEVINIGSGKNYSMNEIAALIGGKVVYISARLEPRDTRAGISLAKKLLGWAPRVSLREGIKELKGKTVKVKSAEFNVG
ncbi:MAG: NAD-dependent epimerase/dehydratase family protein [Candidatus Taylorbacteria bacterium]|nr:NAD-dependent epimerase/dehydratase family protein [Candidatus Taylorbacteria bacterium]